MGSGKGTAVPRRHWQRKEQEGEGYQVQRDGSSGQPLGHQQASCQWGPFLGAMGLPYRSCSAFVCSDHREVSPPLWILPICVMIPDSDEGLRALGLKLPSTARPTVPIAAGIRIPSSRQFPHHLLQMACPAPSWSTPGRGAPLFPLCPVLFLLGAPATLNLTCLCATCLP